MLGLMQNRPLLISGIVDYVEQLHPTAKSSRAIPRAPSIARITAKSPSAPSGSPMRSNALA